MAVLEGTVEVRLTGEDGVHLPLASLGAGTTFGEMALVTGDPVSADVVALTPVRLLRYPAERFPCALGECAPLRSLVMARMAANLRGTSAEVWNFFQQARALNVVMGPHRETGPLVAESAPMRPMRERIALLSRGEAPVLVSGAPGAGKLFAAAKIHEGAGRAGAPFIAVDCRTLEPADAMRFLFSSQKPFAAAGEDNRALSRYGALQLAHVAGRWCWRIGLAVDDYFTDSGVVDREVLQEIQCAAGVFKALGAEVEPVEFPNARQAAQANGLMTPADAAAFHHQRLVDNEQGFGRDVLKRLQAGVACFVIPWPRLAKDPHSQKA